MGRTAIVVDSLADLPPDLLAKYDIHVVPIRIRFGQTEYADRVDMDTATFYRMLRQSVDFPKTSQPPPGDFSRLYKELLQSHDQIISLHISSALSGTHNSAVSAAKRVDADRITVVDTKSGGIAQGIIALRAAAMASEGKAVTEILYEVEQLITDRKIYIVFESLDYIIKGGRLNAKVGGLLTKLKLIPLITYTANGSLGRAGVLRNNNNKINQLVKRVTRELRHTPPTEIGIMHADAPEAGQNLLSRLQKVFPDARHMLAEIGPGIGSYAGPGTLAIVYFTK